MIYINQRIHYKIIPNSNIVKNVIIDLKFIVLSLCMAYYYYLIHRHIHHQNYN
jgi:hypothetical protein